VTILIPCPFLSIPPHSWPSQEHRGLRLRLHYSSVNKKVHASSRFPFLLRKGTSSRSWIRLQVVVTHAAAGVGGQHRGRPAPPPSWCPACFTALHAFAWSIDRGTNPACRFLTPSPPLPWPVRLCRSWRSERAGACGGRRRRRGSWARAGSWVLSGSEGAAVPSCSSIP